MPQRDFRVTIELGDGPAVDNSWAPGLAVAPNGNNEFGMVIGKIADSGDHILGWTTRSQESGDITALRTMLDGTIAAAFLSGEPEQFVGDEIYLTDDASGRLTNLDPGGDVREIGVAMNAGKVTGDFIECIIHTQKYFTIV